MHELVATNSQTELKCNKALLEILRL